ncbi:MAG: hypothetical protein ACR2QJ_04130 [Geminicoccaceae bacterium]
MAWRKLSAAAPLDPINDARGNNGTAEIGLAVTLEMTGHMPSMQIWLFDANLGGNLFEWD